VYEAYTRHVGYLDVGPEVGTGSEVGVWGLRKRQQGIVMVLGVRHE